MIYIRSVKELHQSMHDQESCLSGMIALNSMIPVWTFLRQLSTTCLVCVLLYVQHCHVQSASVALCLWHLSSPHGVDHNIYAFPSDHLDTLDPMVPLTHAGLSLEVDYKTPGILWILVCGTLWGFSPNRLWWCQMWLHEILENWWTIFLMSSLEWVVENVLLKAFVVYCLYSL